MAFAASARGIYYAGCEPRSDPPVYLLNPATGKQRLLGQLEKLTQSLPLLHLGYLPTERACSIPEKSIAEPT